MDYNTLLDLSVELGYRLAMSGAETFRVEESIYRVLLSYGIQAEVFAIPNCLHVSIETAEMVQKVFNTGRLRVYTNTDIRGVELCGALKNVIALASGIATGLGCGDNAKAALITRGIAEIGRLGNAMGCKEQTFSGLAGIGDIIVTATSIHSRNNRCGMLIGQGVAVEDATKQVGMVVEGLNALPAAMLLAEKYQVEMPIVETVDAVVSGRVDVQNAIAHLMSRELKSEIIDSNN